MELIRATPEKGRSVFFNKTHYIKSWDNLPPSLISEHVRLLREIVPNYVVDYGSNWISYNIIPGTPVSRMKHTLELMESVYNFCLENIKETSPYAHGDWALSNILIDGDNIRMCDWDNLGIYPLEEVYSKLHQDLLDGFGVPFLKLVK